MKSAAAPRNVAGTGAPNGAIGARDRLKKDDLGSQSGLLAPEAVKKEELG
jgi:hypothetical protein